tara:strand:+ start:778 stop:1020 length:243 start_codon:yes stop_codon:yes gene_type:complete
MEAHELAYAKVEYYDRNTGKSSEVDAYFRFLPRKGDVIKVCLAEGGSVKGSVCSIHHVMESERRIEPDITIHLEGATCVN